ncbi:hypothetical protein L9F63_011829, partial [Diploptera punctata]
ISNINAERILRVTYLNELFRTDFEHRRRVFEPFHTYWMSVAVAYSVDPGSIPGRTRPKLCSGVFQLGINPRNSSEMWLVDRIKPNYKKTQRSSSEKQTDFNTKNLSNDVVTMYTFSVYYTIMPRVIISNSMWLYVYTTSNNHFLLASLVLSISKQQSKSRGAVGIKSMLQGCTNKSFISCHFSNRCEV